MRFDVARVREFVDERRVRVEPVVVRRRPGPKRGLGGAAIPVDVRDW